MTGRLEDSAVLQRTGMRMCSVPGSSTTEKSTARFTNQEQMEAGSSCHMTMGKWTIRDKLDL